MGTLNDKLTHTKTSVEDIASAISEQGGGLQRSQTSMLTQ